MHVSAVPLSFATLNLMLHHGLCRTRCCRSQHVKDAVVRRHILERQRRRLCTYSGDCFTSTNCTRQCLLAPDLQMSRISIGLPYVFWSSSVVGSPRGYIPRVLYCRGSRAVERGQRWCHPLAVPLDRCCHHRADAAHLDRKHLSPRSEPTIAKIMKRPT